MLAIAALLSACGGPGGIGLSGDSGAGTTGDAGLVSSSTAVRSAAHASYIVRLRPGNRPSDVAAGHGLAPTHVYDAVVNGFAGPIPAGRLNGLRNDPRVEAVEEDALMQASDTIPTGIRRSQATQSLTARIGSGSGSRSYAGRVVVIDTGIDATHTSLISGTREINLVYNFKISNGRYTYQSTKNPLPAKDDNGHGTHVAGTIAANDNGRLVVGVAPGAEIIAIKVLNSQGSGWTSDIIAAVNWVYSKRADFNIKVVNMSLGGSANSTLDTAVTNCVNGGVTVVVAAGNENQLASNVSPARAAAALTVGALCDTDGIPGAAGAAHPTYGPDDAIPTFSNYGSAVDVVAPGVGILSLWLSGGTSTISGTSMASPHVAGAALLYLTSQSVKTPAGVEAALKASYLAPSMAPPPNDPNANNRKTAGSVVRSQASGNVNVTYTAQYDTSGAFTGWLATPDPDWNSTSATEGGYTDARGLTTQPLVWLRNF